MPAFSLDALREQIEQASDLSQLQAACQEASRALGFEHYLYALHLPLSFATARQFILSGLPQGLLERYRGWENIAQDPLLRQILNTLRPVFWNDLKGQEDYDTNYFTKLSEAGLKHGISLPIYGRNWELSVFILASEKAVPSDPETRANLLARANWLGLHIHERMRELQMVAAPELCQGTRLTDRERQCLHWAAAGKTSWEIGQILGINEGTVVFHLQNASRKLDTRGRQHTLTTAVALGEISPLDNLQLQADASISEASETGGKA